jgi:RNA polymerase sigma factor (sigma-70 family)
MRKAPVDFPSASSCNGRASLRQEHSMEREDRTDIATPLRGSLEDPQAFEAVFTANFQHVHRFLARRVGSALADDLGAETFAVAFRRRESFDPSLGEVRAWLFGIATNLLRAHWREEQHLLALEARIVGEPGPPASESDDEALARWVAPRLARALGLLSQDQRDVLLLHAWADLSSEEIASALGVPAGTIRSRLSRARAELRDYLGGFDFDRWLFDEKAVPTLEDRDR